MGVAPFLQPDHLVLPGAPYGDHLLSQLLRLETAVAAGDTQAAARPITSSSHLPRSKTSRIEALKATAASLSSRIESEARKLAGEGLNYGTTTALDQDPALAPSRSPASQSKRCWEETDAPEDEDVALRIQRILTSTGHTLFNGHALPGAGSLNAFVGQKETKGALKSSADFGPMLDSFSQERRKLVNGLEKEDGRARGRESTEDRNWSDQHDSSASSISEGPLLSEGSLSEDEGSPQHLTPSSHTHRPADYWASPRRDHQRLSEFQREAAKCSALSSDSSRAAAWEELNKGSPLSVINIFTKNLHSHTRGQCLSTALSAQVLY